MIQQGLVLLVAGMGIAILFLFVLSVVTTWMSKLVPYINVLPDPEPKKAAPKAAASPTPRKSRSHNEQEDQVHVHRLP